MPKTDQERNRRLRAEAVRLAELARAKPESARARVLSAASELFARLDYNGVPLKTIAKSSGVSDTNILKLYGSKAMLHSVVYENIDRHFDAAMEIATPVLDFKELLPDGLVLQLFETILETLAKRPLEARFILRELIASAPRGSTAEKYAQYRHHDWARRVDRLVSFFDRQLRLRQVNDVDARTTILSMFYSGIVWFSQPEFQREIFAESNSSSEALADRVKAFGRKLIGDLLTKK